MDLNLGIISAYLVIGLGGIHMALTPVFYKKLTQQTMWYAGSGLALVLLGFLNIVYFRQAEPDTVLQTLCYISNVASVIFMGALAFVYPKTHIFVGLILLIVQAVAVFLI